jgi:hypothetical protein
VAENWRAEMTVTRVEAEVLGAIVAVCLLGLGAYEWIQEHDQRIKAQAIVQAQQAAQQTFAEQLKTLSAQQAQFQAEQNQKLVAMQAQFAKSNTPTEIAALVAQIMGLKQTPVIVTPAPTPENPHPTPVAEVPISEAPTVKAYVQKCQECDLRLQTATEQLQAASQRENLMTQTAQSKDKEIATLQVAVKGGTVLQRVGKAAKQILIGGAIVVVLLAASGHLK